MNDCWAVVFTFNKRVALDTFSFGANRAAAALSQQDVVVVIVECGLNAGRVALNLMTILEDSRMKVE